MAYWDYSFVHTSMKGSKPSKSKKPPMPGKGKKGC